MTAARWPRLLFVDEKGAPDMHGLNKTVARPLVSVPFSELCPGDVALLKLMRGVSVGGVASAGITWPLDRLRYFEQAGLEFDFGPWS